MKRALFTFLAGLLTTSWAFASPQANDIIRIGATKYGIFQIPMSEYWYRDGEEPKGRVPIPKFDFVTFNNWKGYYAQWSLGRDKLYLIKLKAQINGKKVRNEEIIEKRFPVHARWYTGSVFISVGDYDDTKNAFDYVIEFKIKDGNVTGTTYYESLSIPMTLNGIPDVRSGQDEDAE